MREEQQKRWDEFLSQQKDWRQINTLTLGELRRIRRDCKGLKITFYDFYELVMVVSKNYNLSPEDAFKTVQNKGYVKG